MQWIQFNETVCGVGKKTYVRGDFARLSDKLISQLRVDWFNYVPEPTEIEKARATRAGRQREAQMYNKHKTRIDPVTGQQRRKHG